MFRTIYSIFDCYLTLWGSFELQLLHRAQQVPERGKNRFLFVFWFSSHLLARSVVQNLGRLYKSVKEGKIILSWRDIFLWLWSFPSLLHFFVYYNIQRYFTLSHRRMKLKKKEKPQKLFVGICHDYHNVRDGFVMSHEGGPCHWNF